MNSTAAATEHELPPIYSETLEAKDIAQGAPTIVLLHGWGRSLEAVRQLGELLAQSCRVVLIDLPGFGRSPLPFAASNDGGGWGTAEYSERVKQLLDEKGIAECILLGHSFGGRLSVQLAAKYPNVVKGVILVGSHGLKRKRPLKDEIRVRWIQTLTKTAKAIDGTIGTRIFAHYLAPRFGSRDYKAAGDLRKTLVKTVNEDLSAQAATIAAPTLLLWGEDDTETPLDLARSFQSLIKDSHLTIFPNKGHEPFADVGSHLVAQYVTNFLTSRGLCAR
jgi:pimeloyl-ACP methyl ester carboxylesterase